MSVKVDDGFVSCLVVVGVMIRARMNLCIILATVEVICESITGCHSFDLGHERVQATTSSLAVVVGEVRTILIRVLSDEGIGSLYSSFDDLEASVVVVRTLVIGLHFKGPNGIHVTFHVVTVKIDELVVVFIAASPSIPE